MRKALIAATVLASGGAYAHGEGDIGQHEYVSVLPTYEIADKDRTGLEAGTGLSLIYGHNINEHFGIEIDGRFSIFSTGNGNGTDFYTYGGTADAVYTFNERFNNDWVHPFVLFGGGVANNDVTPDNRDALALTYGGGGGFVTKALAHGVRFRMQARYMRDEFGPGYGDIRVALGLEIPLGRGTVRTVMAEAPEPKVVEVVKEVEKPFIDSDGDTVGDDLDKCPDTPRGLKVDAEGCIIPDQVIELKGVTFEFDKARLTPNAEAVLDTVVKAFVGQPSLRVEIGGHTDSKGSDAYNQKLSQARASSARAYLISQGARPDQLTAMGYGESQMLIKPETSEDDCELNRRIEFKVLGAN